MIALMNMKFNAYNDCYDSSFCDELLSNDADDDQKLEDVANSYSLFCF